MKGVEALLKREPLSENDTKRNNCKASVRLFGSLVVVFGRGLAEKIIKHLVDQTGGFRIRIPNHEELSQLERNRRIRTLHDAGTNYEQLADRFGLSTRQIRRIVRRVKKPQYAD